MAAMKKTRTLILTLACACALHAAGPAFAQETKPLGPPSARQTSGEHEGAQPQSRGVVLGTVVPLVSVLALIGVCAFIYRAAAAKSGGLMGALGAGGRAPSGVLSVLGRYPVGRGATLVLLKVDRRVLLVSQSSGRGVGGVAMTTLCEITDPEEVASILMKTRDEEEAAQAQKFESVLRTSDRRAAEVLEGQHVGLSSVRARVQRMAGGAA